MSFKTGANSLLDLLLLSLLIGRGIGIPLLSIESRLFDRDPLAALGRATNSSCDGVLTSSDDMLSSDPDNRSVGCSVEFDLLRRYSRSEHVSVSVICV